jgi:hypothetical protein
MLSSQRIDGEDARELPKRPSKNGILTANGVPIRFAASHFRAPTPCSADFPQSGIVECSMVVGVNRSACHPSNEAKPAELRSTEAFF